MDTSHEGDEIVLALRAGGFERDAVEVAELLRTLLGTLSHSRIVMSFKRAFPEIPLRTLRGGVAGPGRVRRARAFMKESRGHRGR